LGTFRKIKGTQDILPDEAISWQKVEEIVRLNMRLYNYKELRTLIFEQTELFARGIGQLTDIVSKEMYNFKDRGKKDLTLKPEMTAPIIRAYIENNLGAKLPLSKIYYISPLFRQENPQAGRLRQFNQFGAEAIGSSTAEIDVELIMLALDIYNKLKISKLNLTINSVGDPYCREPYKNKLKAYFKPLLNKYCEDCQKRFNTNPMRILDCKKEKCIKLNSNAPQLLDNLCSDCGQHFNEVQACLKENKINFNIEPHLVRGLDYYTRTVFEITSPRLGAQDAICGGGRYDLLTEQLGGPPTPAVGFASGIERLLIVMKAENQLLNQENSIDIFISPMGPEASRQSMQWVQRIRKMGYVTERDYLGRSIKSQMREANRQNAKIVLILGDNELIKKEFTLKNMHDGTQETVSFTEIESHLKKILTHEILKQPFPK
jgi:histidyl-tRNA synthetase